MIDNEPDIPHIPHIQAECAECGFLFDLKFGTDCPACHHTGVKWARLLTEQEVQARSRLRTALDRIATGGTYPDDTYQRIEEWEKKNHRIWGESTTEFEARSIDECEAIYALDSSRSTR